MSGDSSADRPRYRHDHDDCTWLGRQGNEDVYYCTQGGVMPTIIFRWGELPEDYNSGWYLRNDLAPKLAAKLREVRGRS